MLKIKSTNLNFFWIAPFFFNNNYLTKNSKTFSTRSSNKKEFNKFSMKKWLSKNINILITSFLLTILICLWLLYFWIVLMYSEMTVAESFVFCKTLFVEWMYPEVVSFIKQAIKEIKDILNAIHDIVASFYINIEIYGEEEKKPRIVVSIGWEPNWLLDSFSTYIDKFIDVAKTAFWVTLIKLKVLIDAVNTFINSVTLWHLFIFVEMFCFTMITVLIYYQIYLFFETRFQEKYNPYYSDMLSEQNLKEIIDFSFMILVYSFVLIFVVGWNDEVLGFYIVFTYTCAYCAMGVHFYLFKKQNK